LGVDSSARVAVPVPCDEQVFPCLEDLAVAPHLAGMVRQIDTTRASPNNEAVNTMVVGIWVGKAIAPFVRIVVESSGNEAYSMFVS
jgi:hypothetical protein